MRVITTRLLTVERVIFIFVPPQCPSLIAHDYWPLATPTLRLNEMGHHPLRCQIELTCGLIGTFKRKKDAAIFGRVHRLDHKIRNTGRLSNMAGRKLAYRS